MKDEDAKDGFDFIEYPCDYQFKAMCRVEQTAEQSASEVIRALVLAHVPEAQLLESHTNQSRTGKFESVTITVKLNARDQLESIYASISSSPLVVMTL